jgi:hypothetical protein
MAECKEPGCKHDATHTWNGRALCDDHYDLYRDQYERMLKDLE